MSDGAGLATSPARARAGPAAAAIFSAPALPLSRPGRLLATAALILASALQAADATIANVALPQLERDLGGGLALGAWVMTSYLCASAIAAPLTGALRRRFGVRTLFVAAVGAFTVASLLCAFAPSSEAIVAFRVLQGAGGGIIHPLAQAILLDLYPRERHGRMLAIWGGAVMVGPIVGPALGGVITDLASWRWVFAINLPLGVIAMLGMRRALPRDEPSAELSVDFLGLGLMAFGVGALELCLQRGVGRSWLHSPELLGEAAVVIAALAAIAARVRSGAFRVLRLTVFRDLNFAAAAFYNFMASGLLFASIVLVPALVQGPLGLDATVAGLTIVPRGVAMMLSMLLVGQLIGKVEFRSLLVAGLALMAAGLVLLSAVRQKHPLPLVVVGSTIQSIGGGLLFTSLSTVGFSTLPPALRTDASGVYSLLRQLGYASWTALMMALLRAGIAANLANAGSPGDGAGAAAPGSVHSAAALHAYVSCFRGMAIASLIVIPGVWLFRMPPLHSEAEKAA